MAIPEQELKAKKDNHPFTNLFIILVGATV